MWPKLLQLQVGKPALLVCVTQSIALISTVFGACELAHTTDRTSHPCALLCAWLTFWLFEPQGTFKNQHSSLVSKLSASGSGNGLGSCVLNRHSRKKAWWWKCWFEILRRLDIIPCCSYEREHQFIESGLLAVGVPTFNLSPHRWVSGVEAGLV